MQSISSFELLKQLTPKRIVDELNQFIVGQESAKRAVAIAIRNRYRRQLLSKEMQEEVTPKNLLMIGPTGVGKTEIARRVAQLFRAPFVKVEATRYTEIGYVGRNVDSMVKELVEVSFQMVRSERVKAVSERVKKSAEDRVLDYLVPQQYSFASKTEADPSRREALREKLRSGELDDRVIEIDVKEKSGPILGIAGPPELEELEEQISQLMSSFSLGSKKRKLKVKEALALFQEEEADKLIDRDELAREAIQRAQDFGIIFIDEIDKIAVKGYEGSHSVSREGVQRDLLPIVEGTVVKTKYGQIKTDHILFIAAGAFSNVSPSDLMPELQGRFPIRVELSPLTRSDFVRILKEPKNALIRQYKELLKTEGLEIEFTDDAIEEIANIAEQVNQRVENIGARRLHTIVEKLLEDLSFVADELYGQRIIINAAFVKSKLTSLVEDVDVSRYML
ncbi:MAG: ATP-dependent protease ATPase subunit HslU [Aquificaceae bacterium]|nr:ATP-dependent protease ATPase subunit HslU [Aquificaceae bacterium]MDW8237482.1 ATP-dependent protease ATPase subunit HslU [Aquificaceae bacterium]